MKALEKGVYVIKQINCNSAIITFKIQVNEIKTLIN